MNLSLNEVEATAKKAARGAGYPWGLAEEAAKATRWLCAHDLDGCSALANLLARRDAGEVSTQAPKTSADIWQVGDHTQCPLVLGAALADHAHQFASGPIRMGRTAEPILLVPFAVMAADHLQTVIKITWPDGRAVTDGSEVMTEASSPATADHVTISTGGDIRAAQPRCTRAAPRPDVWQRLNQFAHRTYAPATEESRLRGAGAGPSDTD
ncbi:MAG: DUF3726 domain-containing protein [Pseudomonadota bacterium]